MAVNINIPKPIIDYNDLDNKPTIPDVSGLQSKPIVVSSNTTAVNDTNYIVVANATFTDPSPVEGKGYRVFVRNGTATIGGVAFGTIGTIALRTFHSGAWSTVYYFDYITSNNLFQSRANLSTNVNTDQASNSKYPSVKAVFDWATNLFFPKPTGTTSEYLRGDGSVATFPTIPSITGLVPETRTINGLDLSANRTLTIENLGYFKLDFTPSSIVTGTTSEVQVGVVEIPANSIKSLDNLRIYTPLIKSGTSGAVTVNYKLTTASTMPSGTTNRVAFFTSGNSIILWIPMHRNPTYNGGNLNIISVSGNTVSDLGIATGVPSVVAYDRTQILRLFVSVQLSNSADSVYLAGGYITNM